MTVASLPNCDWSAFFAASFSVSDTKFAVAESMSLCCTTVTVLSVPPDVDAVKLASNPDKPFALPDAPLYFEPFSTAVTPTVTPLRVVRSVS